MGLYGVIAESVAQRTREIGVRVALGASPGHIARLMIYNAVRLIAFGIAAGCLSAAGLTRAMTGVLYGVRPLDAVSFVSAPAVLCAVALIASYAPARLASRVDPIIALRQE